MVWINGESSRGERIQIGEFTMKAFGNETYGFGVRARKLRGEAGGVGIGKMEALLSLPPTFVTYFGRKQ